MSVKQAFILAIKSLASSKMRSFLTMLGIIIGVASVIVLVSVVNGFKSSMVESFESMGTNLIQVSIMGRGSSRSVTPEEMEELAEENRDLISAVSPVVSVSNITAKNGNTNVTTSATGCNEYYGEIKNVSVQNGRFIEYIDVEYRNKVCVIGTYIWQELYEGQSCVGEILKVNGDSYTIIGIANEKAGSESGTDDDCIYIPYTLATKISRMGQVSSYVVSAADKDHMNEAVGIFETFLTKKFSGDSFFNVYNQSESLETVNELTGTLTLVLVGVAGISLLVGGIGIMNIMLVSVTERTREIGIRKSLGATPWDIMSQFVVEAATTSSFGGVIGIVFGIGMAYVVGNLMDLTAAPSLAAVVIAFSVSVAIGVTFGYFPAKKASRLNPIDALRYD